MMADTWQMQVMAERPDSERLSGFYDRQIDELTDRHTLYNNMK